MQHRRKLIVWGPMGSGKTTVGRLVADREGVSFIDLDEAIVEREGSSIAAIFRDRGEAAFRSIEHDELRRAFAGPAAVIALGGGALLDSAVRRDLLARACVVGLSAPASTLAARTEGADRPLLAGAGDREAHLAAIIAARADAYAETHATISTEDATRGEVADRLIAAWSSPAATVVALGRRSYLVEHASAPTALIAAVRALEPSRVAIVSDETVFRRWGARIVDALATGGVPPTATVVLPPSESSKHLASVETVLTALLRGELDRGSLVVALGGGVVSDIAGFAAAIYFRGIRWIALPTTLLAMVDASVGGKTGVDLGSAKNAVGAFHQPSRVIIDAEHSATESVRGYTSGLAEVVKSACVGDPDLFTRLEASVSALRARDPIAVADAVRSSVAVKARFVSSDEREGGARAHLNFGHTIGHALESEGGFDRLTHGEAVALGMRAALRVGVRLGVTPRSLGDRISRLLAAFGLPVDLAEQPVSDALPLVALDKKRCKGAINMILLEKLGRAAVVPVDLRALAGLLI